MINLLPPDVKESIIFARRNTQLRRWCIALIVSVVAIGGIVIAGQVYMQESINTYTRQVEQGKARLEEQEISKVQGQIKDMSANLKLVVQVLSKQILFSKLLNQIGAALPSGVILTDLSITDTKGGLDLRANAINYQAATQLQLNLEDASNEIFEKADLLSVQCSTSDSTDYPCNIQIKALFGSNNPFLFIPSAKSVSEGTTP